MVALGWYYTYNESNSTKNVHSSPLSYDCINVSAAGLGIRQKSSHLFFGIVTQFFIRGSHKWIFAFS